VTRVLNIARIVGPDLIEEVCNLTGHTQRVLATDCSSTTTNKSRMISNTPRGLGHQPGVPGPKDFENFSNPDEDLLAQMAEEAGEHALFDHF
jgi:hypothetical protein